ncbi:hypothetical protein PHYPSEUDO_007582 [Phytophthora pseudosyringae]|uniref:Uncharacterized protein n=1 Tax=Phytophthora pseudosyringae TaxID=221518 RepID=A0A8T1VG93_9STRA|nr:hypothetical protein PHYPSEUDO_007582 [Phytophthora pseudosyringae]
MDTVRSEYSDGSLASSRLDDGSATGRSVSFSNSHSSRQSIDSAGTRSDYLSSFERKFQERKAAQHKKSEKAKREKEKADRQELFSADARRKAQREAERLARREEMDTWLTDPSELRRIERRSQKRSRDRMRTLKEWYVPATSGPHEEVHPVFVAAMNQEQSNQERHSRKKVVKPLLSKEAAARKDEDDREALETLLHKQLSAFTSKLEYLEQVVDPLTPVQVRAKTRAGPRRRRRIAGEALHLTPLLPGRRNLKAAKSVALLPTHDERKLTASTSLQTLRPISRLPAGSEDAEDDAEVDEYLLRHRKVARQTYAAMKLQATWRMFLRRRKYLPWRQRRRRHRRAIFELWVMTYKVGYKAQRSLLRKYFSTWRADVVEALQLREMELQLFRQAATQTELPRMVLNLVFTSDWEDERAKRLAAKAAEAAKKKSTAPSTKAAFLNAFLSAAFGDVESASDKGRSRVHQLRAQHVAAREEVRKKIVQHVFLLWKRVHESNKRVGLNAQLCLKRAVRMAFGTRQRWPAEILLSVFEIWARWASFNRCRRLGLPLPPFAQPNPHWDIWLHNYQERQVRSVKAAAKAPGARLRRYFLRLHAFARRTIRERRALALASSLYARTLMLKALVEWREAIADSAAEKKLVRGVLLRMHRYARAKRKLRPLKAALRKQRREWLASRAIRGWKRVQLDACFKRELNLSRLENSQAWRSRLQRTLHIWRDERDSLMLWKTFEAWTHFLRKRKLFLTLRLLCARQQRRNLLFGVFNAWKAAKWDRVDGFLEDSLRLDAWDSYRELSAFFPMMFYGSYSDAGSIFGGLPSYMYGGGEGGAAQRLKRDKQDLLLATSGDAVRHFHGVLVRDSVMEVRNAILQTRHLINAVDDASGNTALHVAAQIEEPDRRVEILALLLSEGAATLKRVNRHGLSPVQLAPDADTRLVLDQGIFAFHSRNILRRDVGTEGCDQRLLWCMATLMTREWGTGLRTPADVRLGHWHSTLREELWLRQKCLRFAPDSTFAPAVTRSRGFLNALKSRLCVPHDDFLQRRKPSRASEDLTGARGHRYLEWEERAQARKAKANSEAGEYEAYARYLLATTLDAEACEQELIPSFVGLLFSLEFSIDDVLSQAYRLEEECSAAERGLWELYQRLQVAEKAWSALLMPSASSARNDVGMLRLFSEDADADLFFKREVFFLAFEQFNATERSVGRDGMDIQQEALALEIDPLMIRTKRKLRKAEKKLKRVQDVIDTNERAHREALFATVRRVEDVCVARAALEYSRLRMARALIKHSEAKALVARLEDAKQVLQNGLLPTEQIVLPSPPLAGLPARERKAFLEKEMTRYASLFQARVLVEEAHAAFGNGRDEGKPEPLPEALHPLQKEAVSKLHTLFVLNLLRSCCCWLAENMTAMEAAASTEEAIVDSDSYENDGESPLTGEERDGRTGNTSAGLGRLLNSAGALLAEGIPRRRSSITNTRRILETYHQGSSSSNLEDPESEAMTATYAASVALLFEEERRAAQAVERERLLSTKTVELVAVISERNPVTGQLESPPDHIVQIDAVATWTRPEPAPVAGTNAVRRNRKKEELQRAMRHRRPQHSGSDSEEGDTSAHDDLLPVIHGAELHFGNFVVGDGVFHGKAVPSTASSKRAEAPGVAATEAMWKRGGVKLADGAAPSIKEVLAQAHRLSIEKLRPGGRRQELVMQETTPDLPLPLEDAPEAQSASTPEAKASVSSSPVDEQQHTKQRTSVVAARPPLGRAASTTCLLPLSSISSVSSQKSSPERQPSEAQRDEVNTAPLAGKLAIPAVQISTRSRQSSAGSARSSTREETSSAAPRAAEQNPQETEDLETTATKRTPETNISPVEPSPGLSEPDESVTLDVDKPLQSPVVEISTSRVSESPGSSRKLAESLLTQDVAEYRGIPTDSPATPCIKWHEGAALEGFPLAVTPTSQPKLGNRRNSINREQGGSSRGGFKTHTELDELSATRFVLEAGTESENWIEISAEESSAAVFALQGKSLVMSSKQKRALRKSSTTGTLGGVDKPKASLDKEDTRTTDDPERASPGTAPSVRPISVTVVTKPVKREVKAPEVVEVEPAPTRAPEKAPRSPPKPFVKLDGAVGSQDVEAASVLQLEGMGLSSAGTPSGDAFTLDRQKQTEPRASPAKRGATRSKTRAPTRETSCGDLALQGARLTVPKAVGDAKTMEKPSTGFEGMAPLSKAERERLWKEFAAEPLSTGVQDAYTLLYPQMYVSATVDAHAAPVGRKESSQPAALRIDSTRDPLHKALELNRKFWSAVEGYRAIGTSSLVPLDAATIAQRRHDKAQAIVDQFFRGQRERGSSGESRGLSLPWLDVYPKEVADVRRQLVSAPKGLFDELQRTAELQISAALANRPADD